MLSRVDPSLQAPQALCVCPTRELVIQNVDVLQRMAKYTQISAISTAASDMETPRFVTTLLLDNGDEAQCLTTSAATSDHQ